jgi:hypothetical protein
VTPLRLLLAVLAVSALSVGIPASFFPQSFYDDFPFLMQWVSLLPPYNEHLVTDVGGLQLAFGLLFAWAAYRPSRDLVVPLCLAWTVSQALHFLFHITNLDGYDTSDAVGQSLALAVVVLVPLLAIRLTAAENRRM